MSQTQISELSFSEPILARLSLFEIIFLLCIFPLTASDRLSYGPYTTLCNVYCTRCNVGTVFLFDYQDC